MSFRQWRRRTKKLERIYKECEVFRSDWKIGADIATWRTLVKAFTFWSAHEHGQGSHWRVLKKRRRKQLPWRGNNDTLLRYLFFLKFWFMFLKPLMIVQPLPSPRRYKNYVPQDDIECFGPFRKTDSGKGKNLTTRYCDWEQCSNPKKWSSKRTSRWSQHFVLQHLSTALSAPATRTIKSRGSNAFRNQWQERLNH